jgi:hypothetical protein
VTLANNQKITSVGQDAMTSMLQYNNTLLIVNIWLLSTFLKNVIRNKEEWEKILKQIGLEGEEATVENVKQYLIDS